MKERSLEQGARITSFSKPHGSLKHWQRDEHPGLRSPMPAALPRQSAGSRPRELPRVQQRPRDTLSLSASDLSEDCCALCQAQGGGKQKKKNRLGKARVGAHKKGCEGEWGKAGVCWEKVVLCLMPRQQAK